MQQKQVALDPRYFQVVFQLVFLSYGVFILQWEYSLSHYTISIGGCLLFTYCFEAVRVGKAPAVLGKAGISQWGLSVLISAASLCLLLKTNYWYTSLVAAFFTVASKYFFRTAGKHIFNPSAFGIVATLLISGDAWLSPAQWGHQAVLLFAVITLGTVVVTRVQKLDVSLAFLFTYVGLLYWRQVIILGWPLDHFLHSVSTGSLLLFTFFMISDPRTAPNHAIARMLWAVLIAFGAFYFSAFQWKHNTPLWVLAGAAPLVPLFDRWFKADAFQWTRVNAFLLPPQLKKRFMNLLFNKAAVMLLAVLSVQQAAAFCGFYVSKADGTLKNKTSQVILVRDGDRNVITMYNDYQGSLKDFAMVVPVPVVLKKSDIKVIDQQLFQTLNDYSKPRLVEYYDANPCSSYEQDLKGLASGMNMSEVVVTAFGTKRRSTGVTIEAKYLVGEYDILILSAKESAGLKLWLDENGYKIPAGAEEVLEPYIKSNLKFFVAKVNEKAAKKMRSNFLSPIQIRFNSPRFMLPIRLGMANAQGDQDLLVYAFTRRGRVECTNYRNVSLPTGTTIPLFVKNNFGNFYSNLFQHQWKKEGKAVALLEYAWDVSPKNYVKCDPCVSVPPSMQDIVQAGVWWLQPASGEEDPFDQQGVGGDVHFTRLHFRYNRKNFPQDLVFQVTPNKDSYQARYVITHPATGNFDCEAGRAYLAELKERRKHELTNLAWLTGKNYEDWDLVYSPDADPTPDASYEALAPAAKPKAGANHHFLFATVSLFGLILLIGKARKK